MDSLKEGVKFVFNNKTILGHYRWDMVAVSLLVVLWRCCPYLLKIFWQGLKVWNFESCPSWWSWFNHVYYGLCPVNKNAGMKLLTAIFLVWVYIIVLDCQPFFWLSVLLYSRVALLMAFRW